MKKLIAVAAFAMASSVAMAGPGEDLFNSTCHNCHAPEIAPAIGAPPAHDQAAWAPRLKQAGSIDGLLAVAKKGLGAMPPKGTCMDCTDDQLRAAIKFMSSPK